MTQNIVFSQFSHINILPQQPFDAATQSTPLNRRFSVLFPSYDISFKRLDSTTEKILALKLYTTIILTLGLILVNQDFRTCFVLYSRSLGVILSQKTQAPAPVPKPSDPVPAQPQSAATAPVQTVSTSSSTGLFVDPDVSAITLEIDDEHFIETPPPSPYIAKAVKHSSHLATLSPTGNSHSPSKGKPDLTIHFDAPTPTSSFHSPVAAHTAEALPKEALEAHLRRLLFQQKLPSVSTPDGFPSLRTSDLPAAGAAAGGTAFFPDVRALPLFEPQAPRIGSSAFKKITKTSDVETKCAVIGKIFKDYDSTDLANLTQFWERGTLLPYLPGAITLNEIDYSPSELEAIVQKATSACQKDDYTVLGQFLITKDKSSKISYGKQLLKGSGELICATNALVKIPQPLVADIVAFEAALNRYLTIEDDEALDRSMEDLLEEIGQLAHLWIHKIFLKSDYPVQKLFIEVLSIVHMISEAGDRPDEKTAIYKKISEFLSKWKL